MSQTEQVISALQNGQELTAKQITSRYGAGNPGSVVSTLRMQGYPIYSNTRTNSKGETKNFYRLGTPTQRVVAAGYKALARAA